MSAIEVTHANADQPYQQFIFRVEAPGTRFYVFGGGQPGDTLLEVAGSPKATVDLRRGLTETEWEEEYGGYGSWEELLTALDSCPTGGEAAGILRDDNGDPI